MTRYNAQKVMARERRAFGMMMVDAGDADGVVTGLTSTYPDTIRPALQIIGLRTGVRRAAGMYMMLKGQDVLFCADTTVNICPDADTLAEIAVSTADAVRDLASSPASRCSRFPTSARRSPRRARGAWPRQPSCQAPTPRSDDRRRDAGRRRPAARASRRVVLFRPQGSSERAHLPRSRSGNIAYKLLTAFGGAQAVGPILLGMRKPVTVLSQNSSVETIVHMAAITVATNGKMSREKNGDLTP